MANETLVQTANIETTAERQNDKITDRHVD